MSDLMMKGLVTLMKSEYFNTKYMGRVWLSEKNFNYQGHNIIII